MMRIGFDLSKASDTDGVGTWERESAKALATLTADDPEIELGACWLVPSLRGLPSAKAEAVRRSLGSAASAYSWPSPASRIPTGRDVLIAGAWYLPEIFRGPTIFVCHDLTFLTHPEFHTLENRLACTEGVLKARLLADTHFVAVSEATARVMRERLEVDRVSVVYNGVDEVWRRLDRDAARALLPEVLTRGERDLDGEYVLFVGSLEPRKNLKRLLEAHRRLSADLRESHPLVIAGGQGWLTDSLRVELELDPHVHLLGRVELETLIALYNCAGLFVYPSLAEGFGLPVLEAMACGAPVITSSTTSLPEVAGDSAVLVEPTDVDALIAAMERLLENPAERQRLADAGPARAALFPWSNTARGLLDVAREALDGR